MRPGQRSLPAWRWLGLTGAVLLLHLWLLESLPFSLRPKVDASAPGLPFATRTLVTPSGADLPPTKIVKKESNKPRPKSAPPPSSNESAPMAAPPEASASVLTQAESATTETFNETAPEVTATASAAAPAASASSASNAEVSVADAAQVEPSFQIAEHPPREQPFELDVTTLSSSVRLLYRVETSRFPYLLSGELLWHNSAERYQALLRYRAFGQARTQTSRGRITAQGLAPERFSDKFRSEVAAHFNYEQTKVTFSANTPDAPLLAGAQDRLSVLIQLGVVLASNPERIGHGSTLTIQTVGARAADVWLFTVLTTEPLTLPGGKVDGIKLERLPRELYDQKVEVWLSPQLGYLPARIRITENNGESIDQLWQGSESVAADTRLPEPGSPVSGH